MATVSDVHKAISQRAADIANRMLAQDDMLSNYFKGDVFMESAANSARRNSSELGIGVRYEQILDFPGRNVNESLEDRLTYVGQQALNQAVVEMGPEFVGLIVGEAKEGKDYFRHFKKE